MKKHLNLNAFIFGRFLVALMFSGFMLMYKATAQIPSTDSAAIMKYMNDVSYKIETVLKADKALYAEMSDAMKKISAIKDTAMLDNALAAYKTKYATQYGAIVKKAGVDMSQVASDMKAKFSGYIVTVNSDYAILMKRVYKKPDDLVYKPTTTTTTTNITSFDRKKDEGCGAVSGVDVTFDGLKVHIEADAKLAGGCSGTGTLKNSTTLPSNATSIGLKSNNYLHVKGYAVSVGGAASCASDAWVLVSSPNENIVNDFLTDMAIAPVLWYARYDDEETHSHNVDITKYKGKAMETMAESHAFAMSAGVSGTRGKATSKIAKAELLVTK